MPKDLLGQAELDVDLPDPSDGASDDLEAGTTDTPAADAGEPSDGGKGKKGRSADEVRGELLRKMNEGFAKIEGMLSVRASAPAGGSASGGQPNIDAMSVDQLEALRPNIPQDKLAAFDQLVAQRRNVELVRGTVSAEFAERERVRVRQEANKEAFSRYPDLHNDASPMRKMTNKVLEEWGPDVSGNQRAVLDAANEAASRLGVTARGRQPRGSQEPDVRGVGGRTSPPPSGRTGGKPLSDETHDAIAKALQAALPAGKTFNRERVKKSYADYDKHRDVIVKQ